ncbi:MAG TPA: phosphatidylglycerol lysyltransferase domain-containing protein [Candidatus Limnocylindria bacterium]|nr:phosphatidylglycerol lysyltransferase domain-containing protein [Candidatus Limnocylindria bacterium]
MSGTLRTRPHASNARILVRTAREAARILPALLIAGAGLVAALDATTSHLGLLQPLPSLLPIDPDLSERLTAAFVATGLAGLAVGLARGKRFAWWLALGTLSAAVLAQVEAFQHVAGALLAALCLLLLVVDRRHYRVQTGASWGRAALVLWGIGTILAIGGLGVAVGQAARIVHPAPSGDLGEDAVISWLAFGDPGYVVEHFVHGGLLLGLTLAARLAVVVGVIVALAPGDGPRAPADRERHVAQVAERFGLGALLPFQLAPETSRFSMGGVDAFIAYGRDGRVAIMLGDPIGEASQARAVLDGFLEWCARSDWLPAVYQASSSGLDTLHARGFLTYRIGREAVIDLGGFSLDGPQRANLRHTVARALRGGVRVEWYARGLGEAAGRMGSELAAVDRAWRTTWRPQLGFTVSDFRLVDAVSQPVAVARDAHGRVIAFTTFRSTGCDRGWVLDLIRRAPDGVPGAVEGCLVRAIEGFKQEDGAILSLGLAPLAGLTTSEGSPVERGLAVCARLMRRSYDVSGLAFFKAKFDPRWEERYLAVPRRIDLPAVLLALLRLHVGGSRGLLRAGWRLRAAD